VCAWLALGLPSVSLAVWASARRALLWVRSLASKRVDHRRGRSHAAVRAVRARSRTYSRSARWTSTGCTSTVTRPSQLVRSIGTRRPRFLANAFFGERDC
jgi:hypothetical protein